MYQTKMPLKENCWIKNEATSRDIDKTKTDVYKLCVIIKRFNYEKSYAEFSVSSKKEFGSDFPA